MESAVRVDGGVVVWGGVGEWGSGECFIELLIY